MLIAVVYRDTRRQRGERVVMADPYEWEPRARCYVCQKQATRGMKRARCDRCDGTGYVGEHRPPGKMLAWDVAWSDEGHVRIVGERTERRRGEAFYRLHVCA